MSDNPWEPSAAHTAAMPVLTLVDDVYEGTLRLRSKAKTYLPKFHAEEDKAYEKRVQQAVLFNAVRRTVSTNVGRLFRKPPSIEFAGGDADPFRADLNDVDLKGNALHIFAKKVADRMILDGVTFVLTDHPPKASERPVSRSEMARLGVRPYWVHIRAADMVGWRSTTINGVEVPTQIRWVERTEVEDGTYGTKAVERLRVLTRPLDDNGTPVVGARVKFEVWERDAGQSAGAEAQPSQHLGPKPSGGRGDMVESGEIDLEYIPIAAYYADENGFFRARPPLQDLALENIRHFQARSAHDRGIDVGQYALLAIKGIGEEELLTVGPFNAIQLANDGDAKWVEISGAALDAGQNRLTESEKIMAIEGGAQLHSETRGAETAMAKQIDQAEMIAVLGTYAESIEDALMQNLAFHADWRGTPAPTLTMSKDFDHIPAAEGLIREKRELYRDEVISRETLWAMLRQAEILPEDFDAEVEAERLDNARPVLMLNAPPLDEDEDEEVAPEDAAA